MKEEGKAVLYSAFSSFNLSAVTSVTIRSITAPGGFFSSFILHHSVRRAECVLDSVRLAFVIWHDESSKS